MLDNSSLYKLIIETANEGVWVIDADNKTTFTNTKMNQILGYEKSEMLDKDLFYFMDDEGIEISNRNIEKRKKGISEVHEFKFISKKGEVVWTEMNTSPILKEDKYLGALAMVTDITLKKKQEKKHLDAHRNYVSLFEDCPVPIWDEDFSEVKNRIDDLKAKGVTDFRKHFSNNLEDLVYCAEGLKVHDVNKAVIALNEARSKEHMMNSYSELATRDTIKHTLNQLVAVAENKLSYQDEVKLKTFAGNDRHVLMKWTVVQGYEHNYKRVYLSTTDFTDRIIEENIILQNTNKEKEILLKEIHHRVKNNLQIIMSLLNLQSRSIEDAVAKDLLNVSIGRVQSMAIVHELLYSSDDFSKINYGEYLQKLIAPLIQSIKHDNVNVDFDIKTKNILLNINTSIPLGLLITELVTNSLKHGLSDTDGSVYIDITKNKQNYVLKIGDTGKGFSLDYSIEDSESLGLQLVTSLVEQLSGTITRDSSKKGTHYIISFDELEDNSMKS